MTFPTRHHAPGHALVAVSVIVALTVLFLLFERGFFWLAAAVAVVTLLPLDRNDWTARQVYWRTGAAALVVVVGLLIWLT